LHSLVVVKGEKNGALHRDHTEVSHNLEESLHPSAQHPIASTIISESSDSSVPTPANTAVIYLLQQINIFSRLSGGRFLRELNVKAPISCSSQMHLDFLCDS
jgi:hypothetical protein